MKILQHFVLARGGKLASACGSQGNMAGSFSFADVYPASVAVKGWNPGRNSWNSIKGWNPGKDL